MKTALLFAGQAAQFVGMGKILYESSPEAKALLDKANDIMGFDLKEIMFNGPEERLTETKVTQPAVFVHSMMVYEHHKHTLTDVAAVAGHSLGEITALVAAGVISFEQGLRLVKTRATAMQAACDAVPGTMAAILGAEDAMVEEICSSIPHVVIPANYNCPGQLVISGEKEGITAAIEKCKEAGVKRAIEIAVGGAFHSPLMQPAYNTFKTYVESISFADAQYDVYQNVDARSHTAAKDIQLNLIEQVISPVRWTQTIEQMLSDGIEYFIEIGGKGKILAGMVKKIDREALIDIWQES
jgi:[acyl-carrier-protein] S-malonyltransferase